MKKVSITIAFDKVKKVIESCKTQRHLTVADRMIDLFRNMFGHNEYARELDVLWIDKCCGEEITFESNPWQPCGRAHQECGNAEKQENYGC